MILETAVLHIPKESTKAFEQDFKKASQYISSIDGYISHSLHKCVENERQYLLQVNWRTLEDHTVGFRESQVYQEWKRLLHHYYDPFPVVEHYEKLDL